MYIAVGWMKGGGGGGGEGKRYTLTLKNWKNNHLYSIPQPKNWDLWEDWLEDWYFVLQDLKTNFLQGFDVIDLRIEKNSGDKFMHKYNYILLNAGSLNLFI